MPNAKCSNIRLSFKLKDMIYVIYFFAAIGFLACLATFIILGCVALDNKVSHKKDIHFNKPDND